MLLFDEIRNNLGENFIADTGNIISDLIEDFTSIACDVSNRKKEDTKLKPYIKKAVISEYLQRGADGMNSRNEGSVSSAYYDIVNKLRNDIIKNGLRVFR